MTYAELRENGDSSDCVEPDPCDQGQPACGAQAFDRCHRCHSWTCEEHLVPLAGHSKLRICVSCNDEGTTEQPAAITAARQGRAA